VIRTQITETTPEPPTLKLPEPSAHPGYGEVLGVHPFTGTFSVTVPISIPPARGTPALSLVYTDDAPLGSFGAGMRLDIPSIVRHTSSGFPRYDDQDVFLGPGGEELTPGVKGTDPYWTPDQRNEIENRTTYIVRTYRARTNPSLERIERWNAPDGSFFWKVRDQANGVAIFGRSKAARISDPVTPSHDCEWLLEEESDALGNRVVYIYKAEDGTGWTGWVPPGGFANKYIASIRYSNYTPAGGGEELFAFELLFDYGEYDLTNQNLTPARAWALRPDPSTTCRSGFPIQNLRLCRNILLVNHLPELPAPGPSLAMVAGLHYAEDPVHTTLVSLQFTGYRREAGGYEQASLQPFTFEYVHVDISQAAWNPLQLNNHGTIPGRLDQDLHLSDLRGEGLPGILRFTNGGTSYSGPQANGSFAAPKNLLQAPNVPWLDDIRYTLHDVEGDKNDSVMVMAPEMGGFFQNRLDGNWDAFQPFAQHAPEAATALVFWVDLNGGGKKDVIAPQNGSMRVYLSEGSAGFQAPLTVSPPAGFPALDFPDARTLTIFTEILGDGLSHCVKVSDGSVQVWLNLGYGSFAPMYVMPGSPRLGPEITPDRILFGNFTGSGCADLLLVYPSRLELYRNQNGNSFAPPILLALPNGSDRFDELTTADMRGTGRECLVVIKPDRPELNAYLDFCGDEDAQPYRLATCANGASGISSFQYRSSTSFYLADQARGVPWTTALSSPVILLARLEQRDETTGISKTETFHYRDGYYDPVEQIFRGFSYVETVTSETIAGPSGPLPVAATRQTRLWLDAGVTPDLQDLTLSGRPKFFNGDDQAISAAGTVFASTISTQSSETVREAYVALAGLELHRELYTLDDNGQPQAVPLLVEDHGFIVEMLQPALPGGLASFQVLLRETVSSAYEGVANDPRVQHNAVLQWDTLGSPTQSVEVHYPRRKPDVPGQAAMHTLLHENDYINLDNGNLFLVHLPWQVRRSEVAGLTPANAIGFSYSELAAQIAIASAGANRILYGTTFDAGAQTRLFEWSQVLFWNNDLSGPDVAGSSGSRGLLHHQRDAVFPTTFPTDISGGRITAAMLSQDAGLNQDAGYWWRNGTIIEYAANGYFLPETFQTPFQTPAALTMVVYDQPYWLMPLHITDALGNKTTAQTDYQALEPASVTDENGVTREAQFDPLRRVVLLCEHGQLKGVYQGSMQLANYRRQPVPDLPTLTANPGLYLQGARTYILHQDSAWNGTGSQPRAAVAIEAAQYVNGPAATTPAATPQFRVTYLDSLSRPLELIERVDRAAAQNSPGTGDWAWVSTKRMALSDDDRVCRSYLPVFMESFLFQPAGSRPYMQYLYDGRDRQSRVDSPKGYFSRIERPNAWEEQHFDHNDTVLDSTYYKLHINDPNLPPSEQRALQQAASFYNTPRIVKVDSQGYHIVDQHLNVENGQIVRYDFNSAVDIRGLIVESTDPRLGAAGENNYTAVFDMRQHPVRIQRADAGIIHLLRDAMDLPVHEWTARGDHLQTIYDQPLRRPIAQLLDSGSGPQTITAYTYGNDPATLTVNRLTQVKDQTAIHTIGSCFIGSHPAEEAHQFIQQTDAQIVDWSKSSQITLQPETWRMAWEVNPVQQVLAEHCADGSTIRYNFYSNNWLAGIQVEPVGGGAPVTAAASVVYTPAASPASANLGPQAKIAWTYDPLTEKLIQSATTRLSDQSALQDLTFTLDPTENVCSVQDRAAAKLVGVAPTPTPEKVYSFDALYRLTEATGWERSEGRTVGAYLQSFTYDAGGNLTGINENPGAAANSRRLTVASNSNRGVAASMIKPGESVDSFFDAAGNLQSLEEGTSFSYDFANRLVAANPPSTAAPKVSYWYDRRGIRLRQRVADAQNKVTERLHVGSTYIETLRVPGAPDVRRFQVVVRAFGDDLLISGHDGAGGSRLDRHLLCDHLGSVTVEFDDQAQVLRCRDYYPFGQLSVLVNGSTYLDLGFNGKERDQETGMSYFGGRYYLSAWGRWLTSDPMGEIDGPNLFLYVHDNPVTLTDPYGFVSKQKKKRKAATLGQIKRRRDLGINNAGRKARKIRPPARYAPPPPGGHYGRPYFWFQGVKKRGLHPGNRYLHVVTITYIGNRTGDYAAANAAAGIGATPAGFVWHHYHNYSPATGRGRMYLMTVADHAPAHTGGVWMYEQAHGGVYGP
jgi:RHS repeat-associated protein